MENGGGGGGASSSHKRSKISSEAVISKLKDDGDFDRLRLKIIRQLKDKEELRNSISSMVRQSAALNRPGVENMKPRQLSDAIHQEVGGKVMDRISDALWEIIKSGDGMKSEITETVQSVYNKLLNPNRYGNGESSHSNAKPGGPGQNGPDRNGSIIRSDAEIDDVLSDSEPNEPPGFSQSDLRSKDNHEEQPNEEGNPPKVEEREELHSVEVVVKPDALEPSSPPGFSVSMEQKQLCDGSDEDPDVPPGFG